MQISPPAENVKTYAHAYFIRHLHNRLILAGRVFPREFLDACNPPWKTLSIVSFDVVVNRWLVERWGVEKRVAKERKREEEPLFDFIRFNPALFIPLYFFLLSPFSFHAKEPSFCACGISFLLPDWLVAISSSSSSSFSRFIRRRRPQRGRRHRPRYLPDDGGEKVRTVLWTHTLVYVSRPVETPGNCVSQCPFHRWIPVP